MYRWVDHTAELELEVTAPTEPALFEDALEAFGELVADNGGGEEKRRELEVSGADRAELLVGWLDELVFLAETEGFVPEQVTALELDGDRLRASVRGHAGEPRPLVKAVTLHGLRYHRAGDGWRARVVFDV
jgi:SHS2 domain-containing protein